MVNKNKTVLITGCSTGIGRATADFFRAQDGWNVVETARNPRVAGLSTSALKLDVTDPDSIAAAFAAAVAMYGRVDVVVNNAGYGFVGVFEAMTYEQITRQIQTNVVGLMEVSRQAVKQFRTQGGGTLINVSSVVGKIAVPLYSAYCASKFAVEGFSEALQFELSAINSRVKVVEPGTTLTDFFGRSSDQPEEGSVPQEYKPLVSALDGQRKTALKLGVAPLQVARVIHKAATDESARLRYTVGIQNSSIMAFRKLAPDAVYRGIVKQFL